MDLLPKLNNSCLFFLLIISVSCFPNLAFGEAVPVASTTSYLQKSTSSLVTLKEKLPSPTKPQHSFQKKQDLGPILPFFLIVLGLWLLLMGFLIGLGVYWGLAWLWITAIILAVLPTLLLGIIFYIEFFTN